jgi:hypothetical protein
MTSSGTVVKMNSSTDLNETHVCCVEHNCPIIDWKGCGRKRSWHLGRN